MGGSYSGGSSGTSDCSEEREFQVILTGDDDELEELQKECEEGDDVYISLTIQDGLPSLEVKRSYDDLVIGGVPTYLTQMIGCIGRGWKYSGEIISISGDYYDLEIWVSVVGIKS